MDSNVNIEKLKLVIKKIIEISKNKRNLSPSSSLDEILNFEKIYKINLTYEYKLFILEISNIFYGNYSPFTKVDSDFMQKITIVRSEKFSKNWIPFCENNGDFFLYY